MKEDQRCALEGNGEPYVLISTGVTRMPKLYAGRLDSPTL